MKKLWGWLLILAIMGCQPENDATPTTQPTPTERPTPAVGVNLETRAPPTVAVLRVTPTPLPTATPTPTPTPRTYAVQEGDSFWVIAAKNYVSVEELQWLNPDVSPSFISIGQQIVLPPPATPVFGDDGATVVPLAVDVTSLRLYKTPLGSAWVMGEVVNLSPLPAENVQVNISFSDETGDIVQEVVAWVQPSIVLPQQRAPFAVQVAQLATESSVTTASIVAGEVLNDLGNRHVRLAVTETERLLDENRAQLLGEVVNEGEISAENVYVVATLLSSSGDVVGIAHYTLDQPLEPAQSASFKLDLTPLSADVADVNLVAQGINSLPSATPES